jgi:hypothetical protein
MDFGNKYLTYAEYKNLGGTMSESPFNVLEYEARRKIDERTQSRLVDVTEIPTQVKMCMFNLINTLESYLIENSSNVKGIKSESIDGYSVSYLPASDIQQALVNKNKELDDNILTYLTGLIINGEHVIYVGVN